MSKIRIESTTSANPQLSIQRLESSLERSAGEMMKTSPPASISHARIGNRKKAVVG
jgi:hypothetical protein